MAPVLWGRQTQMQGGVYNERGGGRPPVLPCHTYIRLPQGRQGPQRSTGATPLSRAPDNAKQDSRVHRSSAAQCGTGAGSALGWQKAPHTSARHSQMMQKERVHIT